MLQLVLLLSSAILIAGIPARRPQIDDDVSNYLRIVGGYKVKIEERPFQVNLGECGGSIIDKKWILSAAHCRSAVGDTLKVGSRKHCKGQTIAVKRSFVHPSYNKNTSIYDLLLIELDEELVFSNKVQAVKLDDGNMMLTGKEAVTSGWGYTRECGRMSENLLAVNLTMVDEEECEDMWDNRDPGYMKAMVCAYAIGKDSCQQDSGGPLTVGDILVGVVSHGAGCAREGYPGIYARVSAAREWIKDIAGV